MSEKRLNIGFMVNWLDNNYITTICKGANLAAEEEDANLVFLAGRNFNASLHDPVRAQYEFQHNTIYAFAHKDTLDALIIPLGVIAGHLTPSEIDKFLERFKGIPTVICEYEREGYPCVTFNTDGLIDAIDHLVSEHDCRRIAFVGGPKSKPDANTRLEAYKKALIKNGLCVDERLITYGDFSEYCTDVVRELLDRNDTLPDAICFANDTMALGAYSVFEERGIVPGRDIAVIGYDNDQFAGVMTPPLTTVDAGIIDLGFSAVKTAVKLVRTGSAENVSLSSALAVRASCGCGCSKLSDSSLKKASSQELCELVFSQLTELRSLNAQMRPIQLLKDFITLYFDEALGMSKKPFSQQLIKNTFADLISTKIMNLLRRDSFGNMLETMLLLAENRIKNVSRKLELYRLNIDLQSTLNEYFNERLFNLECAYANSQFLISNITKDMTSNSKNEEKCFRQLVDNLSRLNHESTYIYEFEHPYKGLSPEDISNWKPPQKLLLKAYHDHEKLCIPFAEQQQINSVDFLCNEFTPNYRRRTTALTLLLFNDEQYGIMLTELAPEHFGQLASVTLQICSSIKMTDFMLMLEGIINQITQRNAILSHESVSDELTGLLNRRGFFSEAEKVISNRANSNTKLRCAVIFADLNSLKVINDTFGHEEGDYAIRASAQILKACMRSSDIIGRVGGDEFAALAVYNDSSFVDQLFKRIKQFQDEFNAKSSKPYYIELSLGIHEFDCSDNPSLQVLLDHADNKLYIDKKSKRQTAIKPVN
ncbi:MAG: GGDEF domain-containing protein [Ruminococcaceae bacterium]|nr:GGDEF domain-containing protein [Oscillospiraceae bacterium]